jgi:hypothetical protein
MIGGCSCEESLNRLPAQVVVTPSEIDFGGLVIGGRVERTFEIKNAGGETAQISRFDLAGDPRHAFTVSMPPASLPSSGHAEITVSYVALAPPDEDRGTLTVQTNTDSNPFITFRGHSIENLPDAGPSDSGEADTGEADAASDAGPAPDVGALEDASAPDAMMIADVGEADAAFDASRPDSGPFDGALIDAGDAGGPLYTAVAWSDTANGGSQIYLRRFDGNAWSQIGGSASGNGLSNTSGSAEAAVALQANGDPVVAWVARNPANLQQVYLRRWNGTIWEELAGSASGDGLSNAPANSLGGTYPAVAVDHQGRIVVAWQFAALPGGVCCNLYIYVKRWNGMAWEELAGSATGGGISGVSDGAHPALAIDSQDRPVVAWNEEAATCDVYLRRWNGVDWEELGGSASGGGISQSNSVADPSIAIGRDDNPVVAWPVGDAQGAFFARRWSGSAWVDLGPRPMSSGGCTAGLFYPLTVDGMDHPVVATHHLGGTGALHVQAFAGGAWQALPDPGTGDGPLALRTDATGAPLVAWQAGGDILLSRYGGTAWAGIAGSAAPGGISGTPTGNSYGPSIGSFGP